MPASKVRYCAIGVVWAHTPDKVQMLSFDGKVPVFDTVEQCRDILPRFGGGRPYVWSADRETLYFTMLAPEGFNRLVILTGYDPYDVPNGMHRAGVRSEAKSRDWRWHVHHRQVLKKLLAWADRSAAEAEWYAQGLTPADKEELAIA